MAQVLFVDSFDHYATADLTKKYAAIGGGVAVGAFGRNGTNGLRCNSTVAYVRFNLAERADIRVEAGVRFAFLSGASQGFFHLADAAGTVQVDLRPTVAGELALYRAGTLLATSSGLGLLTNTYYHIGLYVLIHDTTGAYEVRVNGVTAPGLQAANVDTRNSGAGVGQVWLLSHTAENTDFDDLIIGTDEFCGDCQVKALFPAGAGNYSQWSMPAASYGYPGGTGDRRATIVSSVNGGSALIDAATLTRMLDGDPLGFGGFSNSITVDSAKYLRFDFGVPKLITEAKWHQDNSAQLGTWKWQGSNNGSSWTDIGASFIMGNALVSTQTSLSGNSVLYRYYQLAGVSGSAAGTTVREIEFKIGESTPPAAWTAVDEPVMNGDADYVESATAGQRNSYDFTAVGAGAIKAVQQVTTVRKDDAGSRTIKQFARVSGADYDGSAVSVLDSYVMQRRVLSVNPATGTAWTAAQVDAAEFGTKLEA